QESMARQHLGLGSRGRGHCRICGGNRPLVDGGLKLSMLFEPERIIDSEARISTACNRLFSRGPPRVPVAALKFELTLESPRLGLGCIQTERSVQRVCRSLKLAQLNVERGLDVPRFPERWLTP